MTERALTDNVEDRKHVKEVKKRESQRTARERADLTSLLDLPQGRRFIWKQLCDAGVFRLSFIAGDAHSTAFHEGRRSQGLSLMAAITTLDPAYYHRMAKEAQELDDLTTDEEKPETEETES